MRGQETRRVEGSRLAHGVLEGYKYDLNDLNNKLLSVVKNGMFDDGQDAVAPLFRTSVRARRATRATFCRLRFRGDRPRPRSSRRSPPASRNPSATSRRTGSGRGSSRRLPACPGGQRWKPAIQLDQEPAIMVREPDATMQPAPQDNQLMSKHRVLSFKPQLRLEWRGQDGQSETEQPDHSASLGDSITSSTRIRFSVHTASIGSAIIRTTCTS